MDRQADKMYIIYNLDFYKLTHSAWIMGNILLKPMQ